MKKRIRTKGFTTFEIIAVIVIVLLIGVVGFLVWKTQFAKEPAETTKSQTETVKTEELTASAPLVTYTSDDFGITMQIPEDWQQTENPTSAELIANDTKNNISFHFFITKDETTALSCTQVVKDTEDLTYKQPLPGQRTVTKLSYLSSTLYAAGGKNTLCAMMITGAYSAKAGDTIDPKGEVFLKSLPVNRIVIQVNNLDNPANYPELSKALKSYRYNEVIDALESLQVR